VLGRALDLSGTRKITPWLGGGVLVPNHPALLALLETEPDLVNDWVRRFTEAPAPFAVNAGEVAYSIASAWAAQGPHSALTLFERLDRESVIRINLDHGVALRDAALFAAVAAEFDDLRRDALVNARNDADLARLAATAETYGDPEWLDRFITHEVASPVPASVARGVTLAGLRAPNPHSAGILARAFAPGFLGQVHAYAQKNYTRDSWARHWLGLAGTAADGLSFWRAGSLAGNVVDWRTVNILLDHTANDYVELYGKDLVALLNKSAEGRAKKRSETLFGHRPPSQSVVGVLTSA
jgi:hypothetical protein